MWQIEGFKIKQKMRKKSFWFDNCELFFSTFYTIFYHQSLILVVFSLPNILGSILAYSGQV